MESSSTLQEALLVVGAQSAREVHPNDRTVQRRAAQATNLQAARPALHSGDIALSRRLEHLGYQVVVRGGAHTKAEDAKGKALVFISSTVNAPEIKDTFQEVHVPVVVAEPMLFDDMGMVETIHNQGRAPGQRYITISDAYHPMAAELAGTVPVSQEAIGLAWGKPRSEARTIATLPDEDDKAVIFGYERDTAIDGRNTPARRVAFFLDDEAAEHLTPEGWALFDAAIDWAVGEQVKQFIDVFRREWREVDTRRKQQYSATLHTTAAAPRVEAPHAPRNLTGLALSGAASAVPRFVWVCCKRCTSKGGWASSIICRQFQVVALSADGGVPGYRAIASNGRQRLGSSRKPAPRTPITSFCACSATVRRSPKHSGSGLQQPIAWSKSSLYHSHWTYYVNRTACQTR